MNLRPFAAFVVALHVALTGIGYWLIYTAASRGMIAEVGVLVVFTAILGAMTLNVFRDLRRDWDQLGGDE